jgi:hypothetical protein
MPRCMTAGLVRCSVDEERRGVERTRGCRAPAIKLARYTDGQGRPLRQRELCDRHADWLKANRPNVRKKEALPRGSELLRGTVVGQFEIRGKLK